MEQFASHWTDFHEKLMFPVFFRKSIEKIKVSTQYDKNSGYFTWRLIHISNRILLNSSHNDTCFCQTLFSKFVCFRKSRRLRDNVAKYCTTGQGPQTTTWRMRTVCWILQATNTMSEYILLTASMAIYVRGTYRQTQLFYWLIIVKFTTTCFGPIPGPLSGCITT